MLGIPAMQAHPAGRRNDMKTWFITGVSSGLGRALAEAALQRGDRVAGSTRSAAAGEEFERLSPGRAIALRLDVVDEAAVHAAVAAVEGATGGIDILVNNAGYGLVGGVEAASLAEIRAQFDVNVFGAIACMQAVLPAMRARRAGRILNISSVSGLVGWPSLGIYSGTKFALEGISETLAMELAGLGVHLTLIEPGGLRTDFATRSRARTQRTLGDYDATVGACMRLLDEHAGHEAGDPRKAAAAILRVADAPNPPLRLLLGADALGYARAGLAQRRDEIEAWADLSDSIGFDPH
jgi:NAD(P)-dependent dehydrogenase (short-subunit alcohol dehydrogenase family)